MGLGPAVTTLLRYVVAAIIGALLFYVIAPANTVTFTEVIVPAARIIELEPPTVVRWRDRIVNHYVAPIQVATAPGGAQDALQEFCRPVVLRTVDTVEVEVPAKVLLRSGVTRDGWWTQRGQIDLVGFTNFGDLKRFSFPTRPGWDFIASGDSVLVRYPRTAVVRQVIEVGLPFAIGLGACLLR